NPYLFNVYATEAICNEYQNRAFKSAEFHVVPTPDFQLQASASPCGVISCSAVSQLLDPHLLHWLVINGTDTIYNATSQSLNVKVPYTGNGKIFMKAVNSLHGCSNSFATDIDVDRINSDVDILISNDSICKFNSFVAKAHVFPLDTGLTYNWFVNSQAQAMDSSILLKADSAFSLKLLVTDSKNC